MYTTRKTKKHGFEWIEILKGDQVIAEAASEYGATAKINYLIRRDSNTKPRLKVEERVIDYSAFI